jgi:hypothetical protein
VPACGCILLSFASMSSFCTSILWTRITH